MMQRYAEKFYVMAMLPGFNFRSIANAINRQARIVPDS
jgi:hypothetical protein